MVVTKEKAVKQRLLEEEKIDQTHVALLCHSIWIMQLKTGVPKPPIVIDMAVLNKIENGFVSQKAPFIVSLNAGFG